MGYNRSEDPGIVQADVRAEEAAKADDKAKADDDKAKAAKSS